MENRNFLKQLEVSIVEKTIELRALLKLKGELTATIPAPATPIESPIEVIEAKAEQPTQ